MYANLSIFSKLDVPHAVQTRFKELLVAYKQNQNSKFSQYFLECYNSMYHTANHGSIGSK